ncbi:hypothetical protein RRG08_059026 [Elysia crispata]|uniref:Uncharacterized protein n=1 Tax=Elysia crispata TaxID=231223 RepID=A0AAE0XV00_9GAST|nr:hypothetical protein RRG08_059026 [Elysia crispata]
MRIERKNRINEHDLIPLDTASIIDSLRSSTNISAGSWQHDAQTPRPAMSPARDLPQEYPPPDYLIPLDTQAFVDSLYGPNNTSPGSGPQHAMPRDTLDDVEYHVTSSQGHREPPNIYSRVRAGVSFTGHPEPSGPYRNMPGPSGAN